MLFVCWNSVGLNSMDEPGQLKQAFINATAGAASGAVSRTVTSPLDVIKIRFQVLFLDVSLWLSFSISILMNVNCLFCFKSWSLYGDRALIMFWIVRWLVMLKFVLFLVALFSHSVDVPLWLLFLLV